jgi:hypothetical protein
MIQPQTNKIKRHSIRLAGISLAVLGLLVLSITSAHAFAYFVTLIHIEPIAQLDADVVEEFYSGTGPIDLTVPCLVKNEKELTTDNMYGYIAVDGGSPTQGLWELRVIPGVASFGETGVASGTVTDKGALITLGFDAWTFRYTFYLPQYPQAKWHLTWANPDNVNWKLTLYRKGR